MEIFKYFKQIYGGKNALANHISLLSLAGIFVILFIKYTASWGNLLFYENFYISVPSSNKELWAYLFFSMILGIYFIGYGINIVHNVMYDKSSVLSDITLQPFTAFVKMLPLAVYWFIYYSCICFVGIFVLLKLNSVFIYLFASIMICVIPFVLILLSRFAKDFSFEKQFFNFFSILKIIEKSLGDVIYLSMGIVTAAILPFFAVYKILTYTMGDITNLNLIIKLGALCVGFYLFLIFKYVYLIGLSNIAKNFLK